MNSSLELLNIIRKKREGLSKGQKKIAANCVVYAVIFILCIAYLVTETYNPFLYFRF